ncbi:MNIO family chryseobactin maturase [Chryseobacterium sp. 'Rf worker isolate 10']|uniref:MNIO family chryseobactin maturase n=1 Tax=Chryseobacterium sp. 'Rf worker isolate 10' TaxID=2887348 RepID=UPI003D6F8500
MSKPLLGISMMAEAEFVSAVLPLLQDNSVDVLEWSFDTLYHAHEPDWLRDLLNFYSENERLIGHGVYYSLLDARWTERQEEWLKKLKEEVALRKYNHITEHFGFMNTENFHQGVPLPVSLHHKTLEIGKDRLYRLQEAVNIPVGIENLAFSFSIDDVKEQGVFLDKLIEDTDGFLILDLHNIYCQSCNFNVELREIIDLYPLNKVKEIHLSGGSWQDSVYGKKPLRRDTHDDVIPKEIFSVLSSVLTQCQNLEYVIIERLGHTLKTERQKNDFLTDFNQVKIIIEASDWKQRDEKSWNKKEIKLSEKPLEDLVLFEEQSRLTKLLFDNVEAKVIKDLDFHYFKTENWDLEMILTAQNIIKKWNPY